jgi:hypothetical protein
MNPELGLNDQDLDTENKLAHREEIDKYYFIFTRHGYSCNNATDNSGWAKKQINVFKKVLEPHLTDYGILNTIIVGKRNQEKYTSTAVFVSCLIRTWETAVLLYLPNISPSDNLNIIVSPFLKEKHGYFKTGNYPNITNNKGIQEIDIKTSIDNFIVFLKLLESNYSHYFNSKNLSKIIVHYNGSQFLLNSVFTPKSGNIFKNIQSTSGGANEPSSNLEIAIPEDTNILNIKTSCDIKTTPNYLYPDVAFNYYVNNSKENLLLFILWATKNLSQGNFSSYLNEIHVVAHSNIMQSFIQLMANYINIPLSTGCPILTCSKIIDCKTRPIVANELRNIVTSPMYKNIIKTNSWSIESLVSFTDHDLAIQIRRMTIGVPKLKNTDPSEHVLCDRVLNKEIVPKNTIYPTKSRKIYFGGRRKKIKTKKHCFYNKY